MLSNKEPAMPVKYEQMNERQKREVRMYGCTETEMREAVEESITFRFTGPAMYAMSLMSDAQEMVAYNQPDSMILEDQRQLLNRAKWVLSTYLMKSEI